MIDWNDNAKAAVRELADYIGQSDKCERYLKAFGTNKTVADAVEWADRKWVPSNCDAIAYNPASGKLHYYKYSEGINDKWFHCCFREEFEAYVKEQEGEKWTHETAEREYCRILIDKPDQFGNVVILKEEWGYSDYPLSSLKPIKPTMTKEQHEFLCRFSADSNNLEVIAEVESYLAKHDII